MRFCGFGPQSVWTGSAGVGEACGIREQAVIDHHGALIVRVGRAALKGCAARTRKRASALDRVPAAKRWAMMPLW